ncbi:MAG: N-acetylmuramoyl-L-alanine amidase [Sedimentisphaerales bacterium]|nr:N-acetylmuramoyl-L-alanine amidase [Sedimentisphaerales bacterium]
MTLRTKLFVGLLLLGWVTAGCRGPGGPAPGLVLEEDTISVEDLAARLGLRVDERTDTFIILKNATNTVLIFTYSDGRFFVNGKPIGPVGKVRKAGGTVSVSATLAARIRPHLGGAAAPPPVVTRPPSGVVIIDPGHGGKDPGTTSVHGVQEKRINLRVATKVAAALRRKGVSVTLTRRDDRFIELEDRADIANRRRADLFVSLHGDSAPDRSVQGFTLYIARAASPESYSAAQAIGRAMSGAGLEDRGIRRADYRVLVQTRGPAVLLEMGYLSNAWEASRLQDNAFQDRIAAAVADGILAYLR